MVGRVELVTPRQRRLLGQISAGPASKPAPVGETSHRRRISALTISSVSFRNALLLDELKHQPTEPLQTFIRNYGLEGYRWAAVKE